MEVETRHKTVLLEEAITALNLKQGSVVVDATGGSGGHAKRIQEAIGETGRLIAIDQDKEACERLSNLLGPTAHIVEGNFRDITDALGAVDLVKVDAILADLGWSTDQFESSGRGFSFQRDEPLLMTFGRPDSYTFTARDIVNEWEEATIADMLYAYADEHNSRRIARAIVDARKQRVIETTLDLALIVEEAIGKHGRIHPATKTFQALRIAVNDELGALKEFIPKALSALSPAGRLAIITFHSIEDRIVKQMFKAFEAEGEGRIVTKKPIAPSREELIKNPRARSAKLRVFEAHTV